MLKGPLSRSQSVQGHDWRSGMCRNGMHYQPHVVKAPFKGIKACQATIPMGVITKETITSPSSTIARSALHPCRSTTCMALCHAAKADLACHMIKAWHCTAGL